MLLHGAFADHLSLGRWVERLAAAGHETWAPARRGRAGVGPEQAEGLTFDDYVEDTVAVLDALGQSGSLDRPPILVGHSLGGLVAQRLAELRRSCSPTTRARCSP